MSSKFWYILHVHLSQSWTEHNSKDAWEIQEPRQQNWRCFWGFGCDINVSWCGSNPGTRTAGMDIHLVHPQQRYAMPILYEYVHIYIYTHTYIYTLYEHDSFRPIIVYCEDPWIYVCGICIYIYMYIYSPSIRNSYGFFSPKLTSANHRTSLPSPWRWHSHHRLACRLGGCVASWWMTTSTETWGVTLGAETSWRTPWSYRLSQPWRI